MIGSVKPILKFDTVRVTCGDSVQIIPIASKKIYTQVDTLPVNVTINQEGGSDLNYTHRQDTASVVWNINHNLNKIPSVTVIDSAGDVWIVTPVYVDLNNITITFTGAITGRAYLN